MRFLPPLCVFFVWLPLAVLDDTEETGGTAWLSSR